MFDAAEAPATSPQEDAGRRIDAPLPAWTSGAIDMSLSGPVLRMDRARPTPSTPDEWERFAEAHQDLLVDLDRDLRRADADRTLALVNAYDASMRDLACRFGEPLARRDSKGAQSFLQSVGLRIGMPPTRVAHLLDTAVALRDGLPLVWDAYLDGRATWRAVDLAADEAVGLDSDRLAAYDAEAVGLVVSAAASRLRAKLHGVRERLQDDTAGERAKRTEAMRRVVVDHGRDGGATIAATGPAVPIVGFDHALTKAAIAARLLEGESRTVGQLRYDILIDLLVEGVKQSADPAWEGVKVPTRKGVVPAPILTIPALSALGRTTEQARLVGYGPIAVETAKQLAGAATSFVRVLTDPFTGVRIAMDRTARRPPEDMRRWIAVRDELCRFPGCNRPAQLCDVDHVQEWRDAGVTDLGNLVSLSRPHHVAKSMGLWYEELQRDGRVDWQDPWGTGFTDPPPNPSDPAPPDLIEPDDESDHPIGIASIDDDCPF